MFLKVEVVDVLINNLAQYTKTTHIDAPFQLSGNEHLLQMLQKITVKQSINDKILTDEQYKNIQKQRDSLFKSSNEKDFIDFFVDKYAESCFVHRIEGVNSINFQKSVAYELIDFIQNETEDDVKSYMYGNKKTLSNEQYQQLKLNYPITTQIFQKVFEDHLIKPVQQQQPQQQVEQQQQEQQLQSQQQEQQLQSQQQQKNKKQKKQ
jgi:hypothetical protein